MPDPYDMAKQVEAAQRAAAKEAGGALGERPAFKSVSHALDFFDGHRFVASSKVYTEDPRVPEPPKKHIPSSCWQKQMTREQWTSQQLRISG